MISKITEFYKKWKNYINIFLLIALLIFFSHFLSENKLIDIIKNINIKLFIISLCLTLFFPIQTTGSFFSTFNGVFYWIGLAVLFNNSNTILPFDIQIGSSIKPEYMPLRFSFTVFNIYGGDNLNYNREKLTLNKLISTINS